MRKFLSAILLLSFVSILECRGQFGDFNNMTNSFSNGSFGNSQFGDSQTENNTSSSRDSSSSRKDNPKRFTIKKYCRSLAHKDTVGVGVGWTWAISLVLPGTAQIYNSQYKKLPIFYGGMFGCAGAGAYFNYRYNMYGENSDKIACIAGYASAGAFYLASVLDGVINYKTPKTIHAGKAAIYSAMLPGAGQVYLGDWWRVPIYYLGFAISGYCWYYFGLQYQRFRSMYLEAIDPNGSYTGKMSVDNLKYYRDEYRRYRNYSIIATVAIYVLQIVDASVFATLSDFEINDDLTFNVSPAVITPLQPANGYNYANNMAPAYGLSMNLKF